MNKRERSKSPRNGPSGVLSLVAVLFCVNSIVGQTLKADYRFQVTMESTTAWAPAAINLGSGNTFETDIVDGYSVQTLRFPKNNGIAITNINTIISDSTFTIVGLFKFDDLSDYRRVADFKNGTSQSGAYIFNGRYEAESTSTAELSPGTYFQAVLVPEANGHASAYRDGVLSIDLANDGGLYQISGANVLRFAQDDIVFGGQASAGNLARLRIYDGALTVDQVRSLSRLPLSGGSGQPLLFASARDGVSQIYTMGTDGSNQTRNVNLVPSSKEETPDWSPDGNRIAFTKLVTGAFEQVCVRNFNGPLSSERCIGESAMHYHNPRWSPDGTKIAYTLCNSSFICDVYSMNADFSNRVNLSSTATIDEDEISWSPNGLRIAYARGPQYQVFTMNADGTDKSQITSSIGDKFGLAWAPDGSQIVYEKTLSTANVEIFSIKPDGTGETQMTFTSSVCRLPSAVVVAGRISDIFFELIGRSHF